MHDADYRQSQKDFNSFVETLTGMIVEKDDTIPELPCKDLVCISILPAYLYSFCYRKGKRGLIVDIVLIHV